LKRWRDEIFRATLNQELLARYTRLARRRLTIFARHGLSCSSLSFRRRQSAQELQRMKLARTALTANVLHDQPASI
jgi:hypothetical protein